MGKDTDNGRTKFNTNAGQFNQTGQKPSAGQDVPVKDAVIGRPEAGRRKGRAEGEIPGLQQDKEEQSKLQRDATLEQRTD